MIELRSAQERIWQIMPRLDPEWVPLGQGPGRWLAETIEAPIDLPVFDNSSHDGYGVNAADFQPAQPQPSVSLRLASRIVAGEAPVDSLKAGECCRIFTGAPIPVGVTAVVAQENVRVDTQDPPRIWFNAAPAPGANIRRRGSDIRRGTAVLKSGMRMVPAHLFLLAALGLEKVRVGRQPVIGLVVTGSELVPAGAPLAPGKIYDSNRAGLAALIARAGGVMQSYPLTGDQLAGTRQILAQALAECDAVVTSGGVSVGDTDLVKDAFESLGGRIEFWRVAIRPGRPFLFGAWRDKWLWGLPGNPASAWMTFSALVGPALARMQGASDWPIRRIMARLQERMENPSERCLLCRVAFSADGQVVSAGGQASHVLSSSSETQGWIEVSAGSRLEPGTQVMVNLLE